MIYINLIYFRNQDYFVGGDYEPTSAGNSNVDTTTSINRLARSSRLLKRWTCRSKSTFRCLLLMAKELSKSVYMGKDDLTLIEAWIVDLRAIQYSEPRMLPKRRSHTNPCLGADGLHGVSFHPALEPKQELRTDDFIFRRNETLRKIVSKIMEDESKVDESVGPREKRETERPLLAMGLVPPQENATYAPVDWSAYVSDYNPADDKQEGIPPPPAFRVEQLADDSYLPRAVQDSNERMSEPIFNADDMLLAERSIPLTNLDHPGRHSMNPSPSVGRTGRQFRAFLQQIAAKSAQEGHAADDFPILKAMADNMCPGYGPLLPYQPEKVNSDILLIIVFTNHHYDLIPTLEVMYRSAYPNILYCGHPHESVEIFLRKYQSVEHRSFSFLPTYTRATYECVLGAIEMNYEVKGYMVINDETIMASMNTVNLDKEKVWVSSSGYDKVTRSTWQRIDPGGQKLPRLLEGIASTWKLFSYILGGQDSIPILESTSKGIKKRSLTDSDDDSKSGSSERLEAEETAYIHGTNYRWDSNPGNTTSDAELKSTSTSTPEKTGGDLQVSDWDYLKTGSPATFTLNSSGERNDTDTSGDNEDTTEEEVLIGEEEDENSPADTNMSDMMGGLKLIEEEFNSSSPSSMLPEDQVTEEGISIVTPTEDLLENTTAGSGSLWPTSSTPDSDPVLSYSSGSTSDSSESSIGVPLYHVEHAEPPTQPKWYKPDDIPSSTSTEKDLGTGSSITGSPVERNTTEAPSGPGESGETNKKLSSTERDTFGSTSSTEGSSDVADTDLKKEMEVLLETLHETYKNMIAIVGEYQENNNDEMPTLQTPEFSSEGMSFCFKLPVNYFFLSFCYIHGG